MIQRSLCSSTHQIYTTNFMLVFKIKPERETHENIDRYFGGPPYLIGHDIVFVKLFCSNIITGKLKNCSNRSLANVCFNWRANNLASRMLVVLEFKSTAYAFFRKIILWHTRWFSAIRQRLWRKHTNKYSTPTSSHKSFRWKSSFDTLHWRFCRKLSTSTMPLV